MRVYHCMIEGTEYCMEAFLSNHVNFIFICSILSR